MWTEETTDDKMKSHTIDISECNKRKQIIQERISLEVGMIYLAFAILSSSCMAIALKIFHTQQGNRYGIILGNYIICIFLSWFMLPDHSLVFHWNKETLLCGILGGFFFVLGLVLIQRSIEKNGAILSTAFSKLGIMIPTLLSVLIFGERPSVRQTVGIMLAATALIYIYSRDEGSETLPQVRSFSPILLILVMLGNGGGDFLAKIFERIGDRSQDTLYFFILFVTAALLTAILILHEYQKTGKKVLLRDFLAGGFVGIPNYFSSIFLLAALVKLPAVMVYPGFSIGTILLVAMFSSAVLHERLTKRSKAGLLMIMIALILLNL